jgi:ribosomal protein S18 acetylase RimI-like enzyme
MNIRRARKDDAWAVADMVRALARDTGALIVPQVTGPQIAEHMSGDSPLLSVFVSETAGQLTGAILLEPFFSTWRGKMGFYVVDIYVHPAHRGGGAGARLVAAAAEEARRKGFAFLKLDVDAGNDGAKKFYARLGFRASPHEVMFLEGAAFERNSGGSDSN